MDPIRVSAKTLEEAITKACIELGAASDMIDYNVVEAGSKGIFGIGAKNCVITASKKPDPEEELFNKRLEKLDNKVSGKKPRPQEKKTAEEPVKEAPAKSQAPEAAASEKKEDAPERERGRRNRRDRGERQESRERAERQEQKERPAKPEGKEAADTVPAGEQSARGERRGDRRNERRNDRRRDRGGRGERAERVQGAANGEAAPAREPQAPKVLLPYVKPEPGTREAKAEEFLTSVFEKMGMEVTVQCQKSEDGTELCVNVTGDDMGVLIGKRGQTLDALQYLTSQVVNRHCQDYVRVKLDTENYRNRRKETLETLAKNIAHKVRRTGKPVALEPMNPYERRIIHSVLQGEKDITTRSEGEEPYRHVMVCSTRRRLRSGRTEQQPKDRNILEAAEEEIQSDVQKTQAESADTAEVITEAAVETVQVQEIPEEAAQEIVTAAMETVVTETVSAAETETAESSEQ